MYKLFFKRFLDFSLSLILLIGLSPFLLFLIVFLSIANNGTPFFIQKRPGKNERIFSILKFKTMNDKKDNFGKLLPDGDRLTTIGKIIRKTSLDEIPQLFNVIKGEMSFIGPRPERKIFIDQLIDSIPLYESRHLIRPGITGWAQVKYGYGENIKDSYKKLEYDLYYIDLA